MSRWNPSRRAFLGGLAGAAALAAAGVRPARAAAPIDRRFVFVFARGGWDTTRSLSPMLDHPAVWSEPGAALLEVGTHTIVDHPSRPTVRTFFETWGDRLSILDGILVRSVNHQVCERLVLTGTNRVGEADWPSRIGAAASLDHALPTLVLDGPSYAGSLHRTTSPVGRRGQLQDLVSGTLQRQGDLEVPGMSDALSLEIDRVVRERVAAQLAAATDPEQQRMYDAYDEALGRAARLRRDAEAVPFVVPGLAGLDTTVSLLQQGVCRVACLNEGGFDTHANGEIQGQLQEQLFQYLTGLMARLRDAPGRTTASLLDETVVVVLSEMGRTPYARADGGKDHWPYTAAMLLGDGVRGGLRVGDYDGFLNGQPIDPVSGRPDAAGEVLTPVHLGATLLALAGLDPGTAGTGARPVEAVLA